MLALKDIMTRDVVTVSPDLSVRDAMALFTSRHISGAPVVAQGTVVGVVSLTDLAELACSIPGDSIEQPPAVTLEGEEDPPAMLAGEEPPSAYFAHLWEDSDAEVTERIAAASGPEWNALEGHVVAEAMNRTIASLSADTPVEDAAEMMQRTEIHRVLVMAGQSLIGLVTTKDISDAVAEQRLTRRVFVFERRRRD